MTLKEKLYNTVFGKTDHKRDPSLDNIRCILIFLVVFAHLLEICKPFIDTGMDYGGGIIYGSGVIYKTVYSFHMPAFVFLFGCNARFSPKRIVFRWMIPYAVFQTIYIMFSTHVMHNEVRLQYTTPYWIMWFMLVCVFYQLLLPILDVGSKWGELIILVISFAAALLIGYDKTVGYYMSLSRFVVFLPWFVMGHYCRKYALLEKLIANTVLRWVVSAVSAVMAVVSVLYMYRVYPPNVLLYGSVPYENIDCTAWSRVWICLIALSWLCLLFVGMKPLLGRHLPLITLIGQNTLPIFLVHGFVVRLAPRYLSGMLDSPVGVLWLTCCILVLTGNGLFRAISDAVSLCWLEKLVKQSHWE